MSCRALCFSTVHASADFFCLKPACHVWKHTVFLVVSHSYPPQTSHSKPSCGLYLTGFNHAWLSHTLNHAVASLIVCYYPSRIPIRESLPPSSSSPLHQRCFLPRIGCAGASVCRNSARKKRKKKEGTLSSVFVVTTVQINSEEDTLWVCRLPFWLPFRPHAPSLFRAVTRGVYQGWWGEGVTVEWVARSSLSCWATWAPRAPDSPSFMHQLINLQC